MQFRLPVFDASDALTDGSLYKSILCCYTQQASSLSEAYCWICCGQ